MVHKAATSGTSGTFSPSFLSKQLRFCQVAQRFGMKNQQRKRIFIFVYLSMMELRK